MNRIDTTSVHPETISAVLAALIYDEENFAVNAFRLFGFEVHAWTDRTQRYYYAVALDPDHNRLFIVFRGTDGKNAIGRALSWLTINFRLATNKFGFHKGFWKIAVEASKNIAPYLRKYSHVYLAGHSQGSGIGICTIALICRSILAHHLDSIRNFQADLWCSPPAVNETGRDEINESQGKTVHINNWVMPGDLISKKRGILRGLLQGKDVGSVIRCPDLILSKYGIFDPVSHSPTLCLAAYTLHLIRYENTPPKDDLKLIERSLREGMVVN